MNKNLMRLNSLIIKITAIFFIINVSWGASDNYKENTFLISKKIISLQEIRRFFPELNKQEPFSKNLTATGKPLNTLSAQYVNESKSKKITLTVDQYADYKLAKSAYQEAIAGSKAAPGFKQLSIKTAPIFIGSATVGTESHIGASILNNKAIVALTLAGYEPTHININHLIALLKLQSKRLNKS